MEFFLKSLNKRYIFLFTKYEHKDVSEIIDFDWRNFPAWRLNKIFNFLHQNN